MSSPHALHSTWHPQYRLMLNCLLTVVVLTLGGIGYNNTGHIRRSVSGKFFRASVSTTNTTCTAAMCEGSNAYGQWRWKQGGRHIDDLLVVIGGERQDSDAALLEEGYKVWLPRQRCNRTLSLSCHESLGYIDYLADPDPRKPIARSVAFIHGHVDAWHHAEQNITQLLERGLRCGRHYRRYLALQPAVSTPAVWQYAPIWSAIPQKWSKLFDPSRQLPARVSAPISAQFIIPQEFVRANQTFFAAAQGFVRNGSTIGFFWENMWHVALGESPNMDVHRLVPECLPPNDVLEDTAYERHIHSTLQGAVTVDRYMQEIRTNNTGTGHHPGVLVVIGMQLGTGGEAHTAHPALVRKVQDMGYNVWLRHPESAVCKESGSRPGDGLCDEGLGYLTYLGRARPQQQVVIFLRGDEPLPFLDRLPAAVQCANTTRGYIALGTNMTREGYDAAVAELRTLHGLPLSELVTAFIHCERVFFPQFRGLPEVKSSKVWPPAPLQQDAVLVPRLGSHFAVAQELINRAPLEHYALLRDRFELFFTGRGNATSKGKKGRAFDFLWHLVFGGTAGHPSPFGSDLCAAQSLRPYQ